MNILVGIFLAFGLGIFVLGLQTIVFLPLTIVYEIWKKRFLRKLDQRLAPAVSVLVPAYNEENTIRPCLRSILDSDYPDFEIILIDDGSTDGTLSSVGDLIESGRVKHVSSPHLGKALALNKGMEAARAEILLFTDADTLFLPDTLKKMVRWFSDQRIDAVCGNDRPLAPRTSWQKLLVITTHIGTGFVRRALSVASSLHIITGNLGAIRASTLKALGGFNPCWGEDLELTFRLRKAGKRIVFDPESMVLAECPADLTNLWKQRLRWTRSYLKICRLHKDLFFNPRHTPFSLYLPINFASQIIVPLLQVAALLILPWIWKKGFVSLTGPVSLIAYSGLGYFFLIAIYSCLLDRRAKDLRFLFPFGLLIFPLSFFYNGVVIFSIFKELTGQEERWETIKRREQVEMIATKKRKPSWLPVLSAAAVLLMILATFAFLFTGRKPGYGTMTIPRGTMTVLATHFDTWSRWRDGIDSVLRSPGSKVINTVAVGAGRVDWTYFKWAPHPENWSNPQKAAKEDILQTAIAIFEKRNWPVVAIVDFYSPLFIRRNPDKAAEGFDGTRSSEQVCFVELVQGEFGRIMLEMIEYLAGNYSLKAIDLTELTYYSFCYCPRCLAVFGRQSGLKDWPRNWISGHVDRRDPRIGLWRSQAMLPFLRTAAGIVHSRDKKIFVDVPVSWENFKDEAREYGLEYSKVLSVADKIVVWDYFDLADEDPAISQKLAQYLLTRFKPQQVVVSLGLWGKGDTVSPQKLAVAAYRTLKGGINSLWLTPNHLISRAHWQELDIVYKFPVSAESRH
jgi:biofilm PGA synthesis N-glycosyltransferase PgaC